VVLPRTESPRQRQIEDAASALFRDRGYAATSVRDIARAVDIQGASLYAHVASKEDVLWSIVRRAADRFRDGIEAAADDRGLAPSERLRRMIRAHVEIVTSELGSATVFLHEWRFLGDARRTEVLTRRDAYERSFRSTIEEGIAAGEFATGDSALTARMLLSTLNGIALWYRPDGQLSPAQIADHVAEMTLRALTPVHGGTVQ
jgi:AcrR family transcriptional regulator